MGMVPARNKLSEMRTLPNRKEEDRLRGMLRTKSGLMRFVIRLRMKRSIAKQLKSCLDPEYFVLGSRENGDLPKLVILCRHFNRAC